MSSEYRSGASVLLAYVSLARMRIVVMVLVACSIGFVLACRHSFLPARLFWTLLGTGLLSAGACSLNCYLERDFDALMPRTCRRPIPSGVIAAGSALAFGSLLVIVGCIVLLFYTNALSSALGACAVFLYLGIYTPSKRITWLNTSIGSLPGAIPPLIGWASARGHIDPAGWVLFAMLFFWQHTHFLPIAWLFKEDYRKGGFRMLPVLEPNGERTFLLTAVTAVILLPVSMSLCGRQVVGSAYFWGAGLSCGVLIAAGFRLWRQPSRQAARAVLLLSLLYLPVILFSVVVDRYGIQIAGCLLETVRRWT